MTPQERQEFNNLREDVAILKSATDTAFLESIKRYINIAENIGDLANVDTTGVTNGQVLKYNSTSNKWEPGDDIDT